MHDLDFEALKANMVNAPINLLTVPAAYKNKEYLLAPEMISPDGASSHDIIVRNVKAHSKVLDVGCSYGYIGEYLAINKSCEVYGLEINRAARDHILSRGYFREVLNVDLERFDEQMKSLSPKAFSEFDCIICADVLEHLRNPEDLLLSLLQRLKPDGQMLVSIPNINHVDIVFNLLRGRFNYSLYGLLDNTHLKFFTRRSFVEWVQLLAAEHRLDLRVELIDRTHNKNITEPDDWFRKKRKKRMVKRILKLYKMAGIEDDAYVIQNVFKIELVRHTRISS
jgi:2-polyprenyl-3-methyl-5-hydroxy-6-metoxy-1,4-benzoquinol methylase